MLEQVRCLVATAEAMLRDFEPGTLEGAAAAKAVGLFARLEHLGAAGKALAAKRVDETGAHRRDGARDASQWLARASGTTVGAADKALRTAERLPECSATNTAFRAGRLSPEEAHEITSAASKDPASEAELLGVARDHSLKGLRDRCRQVRAAAEEDDEEWAKRLDESRSLRTWSESDGSACGRWQGPPDQGAEILAALDAETDRIFRDARAEGRREERQAYAFDALHALVTRGPRKKTAATLVMDAAAAERGYVERGERCEIPGVGPIPVTIARRMLADAHVRAVPGDDTAPDDHSSESRHIPAALRARLVTRYPTCGMKSCDSAFGLEIDHVIPVADGGLTTWTNLWLLCRHHHRLKHQAGWRIVGATHDWDLVPPDDPGPDDPDPP